MMLQVINTSGCLEKYESIKRRIRFYERITFLPRRTSVRMGNFSPFQENDRQTDQPTDEQTGLQDRLTSNNKRMMIIKKENKGQVLVCTDKRVFYFRPFSLQSINKRLAERLTAFVDTVSKRLSPQNFIQVLGIHTQDIIPQFWTLILDDLERKQ